MTLFLGYDPGGKGKNGVAAIEVVSDAPNAVDKATVRDAVEALSWLEAHARSAVALGIDTLLAWSPKGGWACDNALRRKYGGNSIVAQNSLYSSMTLNGAIVARRLGLPTYESQQNQQIALAKPAPLGPDSGIGGPTSSGMVLSSVMRYPWPCSGGCA